MTNFSVNRRQAVRCLAASPALSLLKPLCTQEAEASGRPEALGVRLQDEPEPAAQRGAALPTQSAADEKTKTKNRRFRTALVPSAVGIRLSQQEAIAAARQYGFEAVEPQIDYLARLSDDELAVLREQMAQAGLVWSAAGLPVDFRGAEERFAEGLKRLPDYARQLRRIGVDRVGTYIQPVHRQLTYLENFRLHVARFRAMAEVLGEFGIRLGIEYVGPKRSWTAGRYPFIHTLKELRELIEAIANPAVGFTLDSWHWYTAGETTADILALPGKDVLIVHLNDAPAGIPVDEQVDSVRELPLATGVIDMKGFLGALVEIGFEGPAYIEPFKAELRRLPTEKALALVAESMKKCIALIES
ncbi:MAG: sugar phosphate isomerase/epimerase [Thermoguttaceae bacterium]|nr:sugar phosphate isomerase/epimerase [Thermoguttaceae bacterium]MDW8080144.1 sugar phosphate isomerase/epimerase family protein [Thermoguttaceae bacterium]